jgi:hypothetical protein
MINATDLQSYFGVILFYAAFINISVIGLKKFQSLAIEELQTTCKHLHIELEKKDETIKELQEKLDLTCEFINHNDRLLTRILKMRNHCSESTDEEHME